MYYRAQLAHYGCRDYKTKEAAKKNLLRAIASSEARGMAELRVPSYVLRDQERLKAKWTEQREASTKRSEHSTKTGKFLGRTCPTSVDAAS